MAGGTGVGPLHIVDNRQVFTSRSSLPGGPSDRYSWRSMDQENGSKGRDWEVPCRQITTEEDRQYFDPHRGFSLGAVLRNKEFHVHGGKPGAVPRSTSQRGCARPLAPIGFV